ncbi:helix-turn-helix domain-containing protein [Oscillatoria sp. FACHB-1407]|uniref:helix-turn-helix domain-containing protein n=1 Tax=Oscillatoria sp. FACHB-1407 TaxID=2692847 RepID=UPI00168603E7|nr:helix-turn-helix domain-containing protein [Oscillatoria sp. FACHB-1407]
MLQDSETAIAEIALECGFANQSQFTRRFQQFTGLTPKVYRDQQKLLTYYASCSSAT